VAGVRAAGPSFLEEGSPHHLVTPRVPRDARIFRPAVLVASALALACVVAAVASSGGKRSAASEEKDRLEGRKVLLKAIVALRAADFVGVMEDLGRLVGLLRCALGLRALEAPKPEVLRSVLGSAVLHVRPANDTDLVRKIERLNQIDLELYEFGSELFEVRFRQLGVMRKSGFDFC
jgi:hypothetical protein